VFLRENTPGRNYIGRRHLGKTNIKRKNKRGDVKGKGCNIKDKRGNQMLKKVKHKGKNNTEQEVNISILSDE
jgi:hypothetical protein